MELSRELLKQFAKITNDSSDSKQDSFVYGTAKKSGDNLYVMFDGSDIYTPVSSTVDVDEGNRVLVMVKNHSGTIMSNFTSMAVNNANFTAFKDITAAQFSTIQADVGQFNTVITNRLEATTAEVNTLKANYAEINTIVAGKLDVETAQITYATIENLKAVEADIEKLNVDELTARVATIEEAYIDQAEVDTLLARYATIDNLNATTAQITNLTGRFATFEKTTTQELVAAKGWMAEGAIGDAQISNIAANKISSGTIDTALVTVAGSDGRLQIIDNTIQISDSDRIRVQIGKDASGDYSMSVWDSSGSLIWDALGATEKTIQRKIIRDKMVADDAAIQALKLDLQSFNTALTDQGVSISGTVVQVGNKTLNVALTEQTQLITDHGETLTDHAARITASENAIKLKVSTQEYESYKSTVNNEITSAKNRLSTTESSIAVMQGQIALKVEQTDIDSSINAIDAKFASYSTTAQMQSAIDIAKSSITQSVSETYATKNQVNTVSGNVTTLTSRVSAAESKLTKDSLVTTIGSYYATQTALNATNGNVSTAQITANNAYNLANAKGIDYSQGKMLHTDPMFASGTNNCSVYNNSSNGTVTVTRTAKSSDNPMTGTSYELTVKTSGTASPGLGGYVQQINSRANAVFIRRIIAKIPMGYKIQNAQNTMGTGYTVTWLTPRDGTGKFTEYVYKYVCGPSGTFSTGGHVYLEGTAATSSSPVTWYVAYSTTFDMTNVSDAIAAQTTANQAADKFNWIVKSGTSATDFTLTDRTATLIANSINLNGLVTFSGLDSAAQSKISTAQSTADSARTAAANAQSTANTANSTANTAKTNAASAQSTANTALSYIEIDDTRNDNQTPQWYMTNHAGKIVREFKGCSKIGLSVSSTYCTLETKVPWKDSSGGYPTQIATVGNDNKVYKRIGTSGTAWSGWVSVDQVISDWCYNSNLTYINGGKIYTGTVTADKIATDAIKSRNYTYSSGNYSAAGTFLDLSNGVIRSKCFSIDSSGQAHIIGNIYGRSITARKKYSIYYTDVFDENAITQESSDIIAANQWAGTKELLIGSHLSVSEIAGGSWTDCGISFSYTPNMPDGSGEGSSVTIHGLNKVDIDSPRLLTLDIVANGNISCQNMFVNQTIYASNWFRSYGDTGWYSETYGGGWYMTDSVWLRAYGGKNIYTNGTIAANNEIQCYSISGWSQFRAVGGNYGFMIRNDGSDTYFMLTNSGDTFGAWNGLRPFRINNASGMVYLGTNVQSNGIYNNTSTGGANVYISAAGNVKRSTSAAKYKLDIKNIEKDAAYPYNVLKLNPRQWFDKGEIERYSVYLSDSFNDELNDEKDYMEKDVNLNPYYGLIAEDLEEAGLSEFCVYAVGDDGTKEIEGVQYDRIPILFIPILRDLVMGMQKVLPTLKSFISDEMLLEELSAIEGRFNQFSECKIVNREYEVDTEM